MATKKKPQEPADADTVIRAVRSVIEQHGWVATGSTVDGDAVVVSGKLPEPAPETDEDAE